MIASNKKRVVVKKPSKKHEPKGLKILYEDQEIIVVNKSSGLLTIGTDRKKDNTAHALLNEYVKKGNARSVNRVFVVHRLDRDTSGILVFAKNQKAKRYLQDEWASFSKTYYAVIHGALPEKEGIITSYLTENKAFRVYSVKDESKGKFAKTGYKVLKTSQKYSLLQIQLFTGRKNQIRVHFAEKNHPVLGDKMYGRADKDVKRLTLHSATLSLSHPLTNEKMNFETEIPGYFKTLLNN